ncbi:MAG: penicillin-binding protein 2 [Desulfobacterales bacterium]
MTKKNVPKKEKRIKTRTIFFSLTFSLLFVVIAAKLVYLQVILGPHLSEKAARQYERSIRSSGKRGTIYDRNMREMAVTLKLNSIAAHPERVEDKPKAAKLLAGVLDGDRKEILKSLMSEKPFIWLKRHANPKEEKKVRELSIDGVVFKSEYSRFYPHKTLAAQVLGFTGIDGHGLEGIEIARDGDLRGERRRFTVLKDALGRSFERENENQVDIDGNNIVLTIDCTIQYIAEQALEKAVIEHGGKTGMALVMEPKTGALLAAAHYPFFNPNRFWAYDRAAWRNRCITDSFEPGSTMKIFSASAAIESGLCSPDSVFFCENGDYRIGPNVVHDAGGHSYGWLSLQEIIKYSSNIGAVKVEELIGTKNLYHGLRSFGFGQKTGIDCLGETTGSLSHYRQWTRIDAGTIAFGQGIAASAIQLVTAASAIANRGVMMKPHIVQAVTDPNGGLIESFSPEPIRRVVSETTADALKKMMITVIDADGTGSNAYLEGYTVCGKTGTAQKIGPSGTYERGKYVSSFIGFVPASNPVMAILVVIDEPKKKYYGGTVSAPVFKQIAGEALDYLNVSPEPIPDVFTVSLEKGASG